MRILNVTAQKPDSTGSGVYLSELMKGFHKMGHAQALIAGVYKEDIIDVPERVNLFPVYFHTEQLPFPIAGMSDEMPYESTRYCDMTPEMTEQFRKAYEQTIGRALEQFKPDMILCHHLYYVTSLVRELAEAVPVYVVCHGSDLRQIKKNPWEREYIQKMIPKVTGIFALHEEQKQEICRIFSCPETMVSVIGTGYNNEVFYEMPVEQFPQKDKEAPEIRMIFAGKIAEKKGVMSLLRSVNYLDGTTIKYSLILAGGYGNEREYEEIQRLAEKAEIPVEFPGRLNQIELAKVMNEGDMFLLPSFYEGLPLVVVEAMACGLKVVCTDLPGIRPWLDSKVRNHKVAFVQPPQMENEDEPIKDTLPVFEKELAMAMEDTAKVILEERAEGCKSLPDLSKISWMGLCKVILEKVTTE